MSSYPYLIPTLSERLWILLGLGLLANCGGWKGHGNTYYQHWTPAGKVSKEATFRFGLPGPDWIPAKQKGTQVLWRHRTAPALIHLHSQCEEHGDSSLESFTDHFRIDFRTWEVLSQTTEELAGRTAVHTLVLGKLDGVKPVKMEFYVFKKHGCLFDLQYIAPERIFPQYQSDFMQVVAGFEFPISTSK